MVGIDAALANAFRRILLAEVSDQSICHKITLFHGSKLFSFLSYRCRLWPLRRFSFTTTPRLSRMKCWLTGWASSPSKPTLACLSTGTQVGVSFIVASGEQDALLLHYSVSVSCCSLTLAHFVSHSGFLLPFYRFAIKLLVTDFFFVISD